MLTQASYIIHDNGGRPFKVGVVGDQVMIYNRIDDDDDGYYMYEEPPAATLTALRVFPGECPDGTRCLGNTVVVQTGLLEYIHVGGSIFRFRTLSPIVSYMSPIGNSDVPYPYATDEGGNVYLLAEDVVLLNSILRFSLNPSDARENSPQVALNPSSARGNLLVRAPTASIWASYNDPYDYYYAAYLITSDNGVIPPKQPLEIFEGITDLFHGDERYTFKYDVHADIDYDRCEHHFGPTYIATGFPDVPSGSTQLTRASESLVDVPSASTPIIQNGVHTRISRDDYVALMQRFAQHRGFMKLEVLGTICERFGKTFNFDHVNHGIPTHTAAYPFTKNNVGVCTDPPKSRCDII
jgi:hypothetical protein